VTVDTTYNVLKFLHVAAVIVAVGGVVALSVINARLGREGDRAVLASVARQSVFYGKVVITPAAIVILIAGIVMVLHAGMSFGAFWITWGFIGLFGFALIGGVFVNRAGAELSALMSTGKPDDPRVMILQRRLAALSVLELLLLLSVVWVMVFKSTL
jgi:uncharacterized membrane protein